MTDRPSDRAIAWMPGLRTRSAPTNSAEISSKSVVEPTAEHWRRAIEEWEGRMLPSSSKLKQTCDRIEQRARELAQDGGVMTDPCRICKRADCDDDCEELAAIYREQQREKLRDLDMDEIERENSHDR